VKILFTIPKNAATETKSYITVANSVRISFVIYFLQENVQKNIS
jgi:hypothetical protein